MIDGLNIGQNFRKNLLPISLNRRILAAKNTISPILYFSANIFMSHSPTKPPIQSLSAWRGVFLGFVPRGTCEVRAGDVDRKTPQPSSWGLTPFMATALPNIPIYALKLGDRKKLN